VGAIGCALAWLPVTIGPVRSLREVPYVEQQPALAEGEVEALLPGPYPQLEER
jgi:hypothetical protein